MTLMECLVTLAIMAILVALGVPSLSDQLSARRAHAGAHQIYSAVQYARGMAQTLAVGVTVCPLSATAGLTNPCGGDFGGSLVVYQDTVNGPEILRVWAPNRGVVVRNRSGLKPVTGAIRWRADGIGQRNLSLSVCTGSHNWTVVVNRLGRPRLVKDGGLCPDIAAR